MYYLDGDDLMRAESLNIDGTPAGVPVAENVQSFEVTLIFTDGDEADNANATDADLTNDYDDIAGVRVRLTVAADRVHPQVNNGALFTRMYDWVFSPRNLLYERNRI